MISFTDSVWENCNAPPELAEDGDKPHRRETKNVSRFWENDAKSLPLNCCQTQMSNIFALEPKRYI